MSQEDSDEHNSPPRHHTDSEGEEDLDNKSHDSDKHESSREETKDEDDANQSEELEHAHGDVDMSGKKAKAGYAQITDTQRDDDDSVHFDEQEKPLGVSDDMQNIGDFQRQPQMQKMQPHQDYDPSKAINVIQCCLDGSFKPFLACVQLGYIDKDYLIDPQLGRKVIHLIAHFGNVKSMRVIHEIWKADIKTKDYQGLNPLHYAAGSGELEMLKYLWEQTDENAIEEEDMAGMTPLMHAASKNSVFCFIYLYFARKANIKTVDKKGCNVVHWATYSGSLPILKILAQVGVLREFKDKIDDLSQTPLIKSFFNKNIEAMKLLIQANCDLYIRDYRQNTPEEFIQRYLPDQQLYDQFLRCKYKQFLRSSVNFYEVRNGFQRNKIFVSEMLSYYYSKHSNLLSLILFFNLLILMLVTHWVFRSSLPTEGSLFQSLVSFFMYVSMLGSVGLFFFFRQWEVRTLSKKDIDDETGVIEQTLKYIEEGDFSRIGPLKEIWFNTNVRKIKHAEYCEQSDSYVLEYHKFCNFLQSPIGAGNSNIYFLWLFVSLIAIGFFNLSLLTTYWGANDVIFYYRPYAWILSLFSKSLIIFSFYIVIQLANVIFFQNWIWMVHATGRRQTINETKNAHLYRYIYKRVLDKETKNYLYIHRYYSLIDMAKNIWLFLLNKQRNYDVNPEDGATDLQRFSNVSLSSVNTVEDTEEF
jgi:ankyrin repeat protein